MRAELSRNIPASFRYIIARSFSTGGICLVN
jgi:hypothetical protein